ncbi:MAG: glycosyltransferase family 2 protein [Elusimicrobiota bacterium]
MRYQNISIVIPTFNGKKLLEKYLSSIINACKNYSFGKTELIVVDDASNDGTANYLKLNFPLVKVIRQDTNEGFSVSVNKGIFSSKNEITVLLNNDVEIQNNFLSFFPQCFEDENVFAVRPALENSLEDKIIKNTNIAGGFKYGFFDVPKVTKKELKFAFFSGGGASAYDKKKFVELGGFDEIFAPFYYEDVDLSYRAWKRGWKIVYEPRSSAYHMGGTTISKHFSAGYINIISQRNKYFLVWKNITDDWLLLKHFVFIPIIIMLNLIKGNFDCLFGFLKAIKAVKKIIKKRKHERKFVKISDQEIFDKFKEN